MAENNFTQELPAGNSPRVPYSAETTLGELIALHIRDVGEMQTFGDSHMFTLRRLQRQPLAGKVAAKLKSGDFMVYCRERIAAGTNPATVMGDITALRGPLKMAKILWGIKASTKPIDEAMPLLKRLGLVSKSKPRERRPTDDELKRLIEHFEKRDKHPNCEIPMAVITRFQIASGRRIGETCRLRWDDVNFEERTILVRDLKDPKRKKGSGNHAVAPLLGEAWDILIAQPRIEGEPRIFPYNSESCSKRYIDAKKFLNIVDLRLHDSRRECASRMIEDAFSVPEVMLVTLHKNPTVLMRTYTKLRPADLHKGPAARRGKGALKEVAASMQIVGCGYGGGIHEAPLERTAKPRLRGPVAEVAAPA